MKIQTLTQIKCEVTTREIHNMLASVLFDIAYEDSAWVHPSCENVDFDDTYISYLYDMLKVLTQVKSAEADNFETVQAYETNERLKLYVRDLFKDGFTVMLIPDWSEDIIEVTITDVYGNFIMTILEEELVY